MKPFYRSPQKSLWQGRSDGSGAERYHEKITLLDMAKGLPVKKEAYAYALLGFASDAGIIRNQGRPGAKEGPQALRQAIANLPTHLPDSVVLYDAGDIVCSNGDLEGAQKALGDAVASLHARNIIPLVIGGGHEVAWGHYQGIAKTFPEEDIAIVNFDAHFDLRQLLEDGRGTSGTPFTQIAFSRQKQSLPFHYACIGIQQFGNTPALFETAKHLGTHVLPADFFHQGGMDMSLEFIDTFANQHRYLYVTVCLDVFDAAHAPGVSAPQPLGLLPWHVIPLLRKLAASGRVAGFNIAELSPPLDESQKTAKLAAFVLADFLQRLYPSKLKI